MEKVRTPLFVLSVFVAVYWYLVQYIDVYQYAVLGVLYEILWLPALGLIHILPLINLYLLVKSEKKFNNLFLYGFLITTTSLLLIYLK